MIKYENLRVIPHKICGCKDAKPGSIFTLKFWKYNFSITPESHPKYFKIVE